MRDMLGIKDPSTLGNGEDEAQKQREKTAYDQYVGLGSRVG